MGFQGSSTVFIGFGVRGHLHWCRMVIGVRQLWFPFSAILLRNRGYTCLKGLFLFHFRGGFSFSSMGIYIGVHEWRVKATKKKQHRAKDGILSLQLHVAGSGVLISFVTHLFCLFSFFNRTNTKKIVGSPALLYP